MNKQPKPHLVMRKHPDRMVAELDEYQYHLLSLDGLTLSYMSDEDFDRLKDAMINGARGRSGAGIARSVANCTYKYMAAEAFNPSDRESIKITAMLMRTLYTIGELCPADDDITKKAVDDGRILARTRMSRIEGFAEVNLRREDNGSRSDERTN